MQFNKNKSSPSILSIVNVVFTRKKQNSRKKASTIFFIKRGQETGGERRGEEEVAVECLLMLQSSSLSHEPQPTAEPPCQLPHAWPPPPSRGGNICTGGNQCNILLITESPRERWRYNMFTLPYRVTAIRGDSVK